MFSTLRTITAPILAEFIILLFHDERAPCELHIANIYVLLHQTHDTE